LAININIINFILLVGVVGICSSADYNYEKIAATGADYDGVSNVFLDDLAKNSWSYLHSNNSTKNALPYSWYSSLNSGGDFSNPTEIGLYALCWIATYDLKRPWSPSWKETEENVTRILNQLIKWQESKDNSYKGKVFYQYYWLEQLRVGDNANDKVVPSIDNAWLALSLITVREFCEENGHQMLANKANSILEKMDFRLWYDSDDYLIYLGENNESRGGIKGDYYSNENRIVNFVGRALGQFSPEEFNQSLKALKKVDGAYKNIHVDSVNWNGSYFTYVAPALFIREMETYYGNGTIIPATMTQIIYAENNNYSAWGLSDCFDIGLGSYIRDQGAPPKGSLDQTGIFYSENRTGIIAPYVSALALITPFEHNATDNLRKIRDEFGCAYDPSYGFKDSVMANPNNTSYKVCSDRFSALSQEWMILSLVDQDNGFIWRYLYKDNGVRKAHEEVYGPLKI
jgi:hypothetical protein